MAVELGPYLGAGLALHRGRVCRELGVNDELELGTFRRADQLVVERHGFGNGYPVAILLDHVEHPLAECLGYRSAGEHGEEVAAAQAEDARAPLRSKLDLCAVFNKLRHVTRKFVFIAVIKASDIIIVGIAQGTSKLRRLEPRLIVAGDGGEREIVEAKRLRHNQLLLLRVGTADE